MSSWHWKQDYEALLREGMDTGEVAAHSEADERRGMPRFRLKSKHVWMRVEQRFPVMDVSVSGIAVYSDVPFDLGQLVNITLGKAFTVEAEVIECRLEEADARLLETKYRVRCQFEDESAGMQFLVMMKQMDDLEIEPVKKGSRNGS